MRTAVNVLGDAFGAAIVAHLSQKELTAASSNGTEMEQMDKELDVEKSKLMEIVKFDEEHEEERTLLVTEDTKATVGDHLSPLSYDTSIQHPIQRSNHSSSPPIHITFIPQ